MKESNNLSDREQALAQLRRLADLILDNLAEGSRNKLLDPKEIRLMTGTATRTIRLYVRTLEGPTPKKADPSSQNTTKNAAQQDQNNPGQE